MRRRGDLRNLLQQLHIFRTFAELVVADESAEGMSAEDAELFFVDLLEHGALVELGGALQVAEQIFLGAVQTLIFRFSLVSVWSSRYFRPRQLASSFWNAGVMQHFIQLQGKQVVDLRDTRVDHRLGVA